MYSSSVIEGLTLTNLVGGERGLSPQSPPPLPRLWWIIWPSPLFRRILVLLNLDYRLFVRIALNSEN